MRSITTVILVLVLIGCATSPQAPSVQKTSRAPSPMATAAQAPHPAPSVPEMLALSDIPAKLDPAHPLRIGEEYYPLESRRLGEEGSCVIRLQVDSDGYIRATELASSTGFERLNEACLASASNGRLIPATVGGKPATSWFFLRVNWKLTGSTLALRPHVRDDYHLKVGPEYYPPISRKLHQEGDCVVHVTVDEDGPPSTVTIAKSAGYAPLDEACLSAVREAQFTAARVGGVRTQSSTDIGISWRLHDP